jgi:hypothetical protein
MIFQGATLQKCCGAFLLAAEQACTSLSLPNSGITT